jgi:hypothetical protein
MFVCSGTFFYFYIKGLFDENPAKLQGYLLYFLSNVYAWLPTRKGAGGPNFISAQEQHT